MMGRFHCFTNELELREIPLLGKKFTWSNERVAPTLIRLDRVFVSSDWDNLFPDCLLQSVASLISDHCPLRLGLLECTQGKRRFHFESYWPKLDCFLEKVQRSWNLPVQATCPLQRLADKLKRLANHLQSWSQRRVGNVKKKLHYAKELLHQLEIAQDSRPLSPYEVWLHCQLKWHALGLASLERTIAQLRSQLSWLKEGDVNTAYFQRHARHRKRKKIHCQGKGGGSDYHDPTGEEGGGVGFLQQPPGDGGAARPHTRPIVLSLCGLGSLCFRAGHHRAGSMANHQISPV